MYNPFKEVIDEEQLDRDLIEGSLNGDSVALETLILRHQSWIYNIALRMLCDPFDAEDVTQEVLIKIITKLALYDPEASAFRTWLYRIVANHIINWKKSKTETLISDIGKAGDFEAFASTIPDKRISRKPEIKLLYKEAKMTCIHCMLLILNRRERMVFILGVIFDVKDTAGSEICEISRDNFRKILSRSREKLNLFFSTQCSIVKESNPCRCSDRLPAMLKLDFIDPEKLLSAKQAHATVEEILNESIINIEDAYYEFNKIFRSQPFFTSPDMTLWLREQLNRDDIRGLFQIN